MNAIITRIKWDHANDKSVSATSKVDFPPRLDTPNDSRPKAKIIRLVRDGQDVREES